MDYKLIFEDGHTVSFSDLGELYRAARALGGQVVFVGSKNYVFKKRWSSGGFL